MTYEALVGSDIGVLKAGADLSAKQYRFVKVDTAVDDQVVGTTAATDEIVGVLQNDPTSGQAAAIRTVGISKLLLGGTVTRGDRLTSDATGRGILAAGSQVVGAIALHSGVVGDIIPALVLVDGTDFLANVVAATGAGFKIARGVHRQVAASDTVVTGLATVVAVVATPVVQTVKQLFFGASIGDQAGAPAAGSILITSKKPTAVNDVTPVAATDFTDNIDVNWIAIGT
jgi:hypothetical protein